MTDIETWTSDKGHEELHHFLDGDPTTYVWGINRRLLGDDAYGAMRMIVLERLEQLKLLSQLQSVPSLSQLTSTP